MFSDEWKHSHKITCEVHVHVIVQYMYWLDNDPDNDGNWLKFLFYKYFVFRLFSLNFSEI